MNIAIPAPQIVENKVICFNPVGYPPKVAKKSLAPRLESLDGKTVYLIDSRFDDSIELLKEVANWFASHMPAVTIKLVSLAGYYGRDDQELWTEIKANGVLVADDQNATLTVQKKTKDASGTSTTTTTQNFKLDGGQCLVSR